MEDNIFDKIEEVDLKKKMEESYIDYAMSVIAARALPDVRDGLKPVQLGKIMTLSSQMNADITLITRPSTVLLKRPQQHLDALTLAFTTCGPLTQSPLSSPVMISKLCNQISVMQLLPLLSTFTVMLQSK